MSSLAIFIAVLILLLWRRPKRAIERVTRSHVLTYVCVVFSVLVIMGPLLCATRHMIYHDEPTLISVALAEWHGQPLYHGPDSPDRYSLLYGPATYWLYLPPRIFGMDLRLFQLWVMVPLTLSVIGLWKLASSARNRFGQALVLLWGFAAILDQANNEWAMKGDAWLLCCSTLALCAAWFLTGVPAVLTMAVLGAVMIDIKATTGLLALLPVAIYIYRRNAQRMGVITTLAMFALAASAFLVKGVSLRNYAFWLRESANHGLSRAILFRNVRFLVLVVLPAAVLFWLWRRSAPRAASLTLRDAWLPVSAGILAVLSLTVSGAKAGAGPWHCVPLVPLFVLLGGLLWERLQQAEGGLLFNDTRAAAAVSLLVAGLFAMTRASAFAVLFHWKGVSDAIPGIHGSAVADDLRAIAHSHPGLQIGMGYGDNSTYELTWQRPLLVALGNYYSQDADSVAEMDLSGLPVPPATLNSLKECQTQIWLVPKGDKPFSMESYYYRVGQHVPRFVFSDQFRQVFLQSYHRETASRYFDVWACSSRQ